MRVKAKLLRRKAYGLEQTGEVHDNQPMNIEDTSTPLTQHKTPINPVNTIRDPEAETDFPGLGKHMQRFPGRGRT